MNAEELRTSLFKEYERSREALLELAMSRYLGPIEGGPAENLETVANDYARARLALALNRTSP